MVLDGNAADNDEANEEDALIPPAAPGASRRAGPKVPTRRETPVGEAAGNELQISPLGLPEICTSKEMRKGWLLLGGT